MVAATGSAGRRLLLALLSTAVTSSGCDVDQAPHGATRRSITNGSADDGDPAVVALLYDGVAFCTGTLVSPRVVVTAAHCLDAPDIDVFFGAAVTGAGVVREVADALAHPDFERETLTHDIAVLLLAEAAPSLAAPVTMARDPLGDIVGEPLRLVGFGLSEAEDGETGEKRQGYTRVAAFDDETLTFLPEPSQTCMGDSGGPAFLTVDGGEVLAGVTSSGDPGCAEYGKDTRVDVHVDDFIAPYVADMRPAGRVAGERCYYDDQCAVGACVFPDDAPSIGYCAAPCADQGDCPDGMACDAFGGAAACRYPPPSPGAFGTGCSADGDCDSGVCGRAQGSAEASCTQTCIPEAAQLCPSEATCVEDADATRTICDPARAGCSAGDSSRGRVVWILVLCACCAVSGGAGRRRRPR